MFGAFMSKTEQLWDKLGEVVAPVQSSSQELQIAIRKGDWPRTRDLLNAPDVDAFGATNDVPPLHLAAAEDFVECVDALLGRGVDVNLRDRRASETPLHHAARAGHFRICQLLVERGASLVARNVRTQTPYDVAADLSLRQWLLPLQLKAEAELEGPLSQSSSSSFVVAPPPTVTPAQSRAPFALEPATDEPGGVPLSNNANPGASPESPSVLSADSPSVLRASPTASSRSPPVVSLGPPPPPPPLPQQTAPRAAGVQTGAPPPTQAGPTPAGGLRPSRQPPLTTTTTTTDPPVPANDASSSNNQGPFPPPPRDSAQTGPPGSYSHVSKRRDAFGRYADGFHSSSSDPILQAKYGHTQKDYSHLPPPPTAAMMPPPPTGGGLAAGSYPSAAVSQQRGRYVNYDPTGTMFAPPSSHFPPPNGGPNGTPGPPSGF